MTYPQQNVYVADGFVLGVITIYTPDATATGPVGSTDYIVSPPNYAIQPGWKCTLDTLNNPTFSAP